MTREEAIKWFENAVPKNCSECAKEMNISAGGWVSSCNHSDSLRCEAYSIARAALREQEERSKAELSEPCEWCWHFAQDPQHLFAEGNRRYRELIYQFGPNCGRKLENRLEDGERFCSRCGQKRPVACTVDGKPWCEDCLSAALDGSPMED